MDTKERRRRPKPSPTKRTSGTAARKKERKLRDSDVVYTPPKPFHRGRFLLRLVTVVAVVLAVVLGMSIFFKVDNVRVSGCNKYSAWEVAEASGVEDGMNLMTISRAQISGSIIDKLPYVNKVRVGINLPDTVIIEITEVDAVYAIEDAEGGWWLMNDEGRIVDQTNNVSAENDTKILGVQIQLPQVGDQAVAKEAELPTIPVMEEPVEDTAEDTDEEVTEETEVETTVPTVGATVAVGVTGADRLRTVLTVLQELSTNSISGMIDSVDVTSLTAIELWYDERFQVNLGDTSQLEYKVSALKATIEQMESYESGHLDLSFTNWPDMVGYTPFT